MRWILGLRSFDRKSSRCWVVREEGNNGTARHGRRVELYRRRTWQWPFRDLPDCEPAVVAGALTLMSPLSPCILTCQPFVQARSDGEWPTPTGCSLAPSRRAYSTIRRHSSTVDGAYTRSGRQWNVLAQLAKVARFEFEGIETC